MNNKYYTFLFLLCLVSETFSQNNSSILFELWDINSLTTIGGHTVTVDGNPVVVTDPQMGDAVKFDGNGDMLTVDAAPVGASTQFTVEVIFKPDAGAINIANEPRFVCFWDPANASSGPRMTIELRATAANAWYFDGFLKTDLSNLTLIDAAKTHPIGQWMHAAITYQNGTLSTYVNGVLELSGALNFTSKVLNPSGKVSVGARYNKTNWYSGLIKTIKVTQAALQPSEFIVNTIPTYTPKVLCNTDFKVYPLPADCKLFVVSDSQGSGKVLSASLFSLSGKKILLDINYTNENECEINTQNIKTGIYMLKVQTSQGMQTRKVQIIH